MQCYMLEDLLIVQQDLRESLLAYNKKKKRNETLDEDIDALAIEIQGIKENKGKKSIEIFLVFVIAYEHAFVS